MWALDSSKAQEGRCRGDYVTETQLHFRQKPGHSEGDWMQMALTTLFTLAQAGLELTRIAKDEHDLIFPPLPPKDGLQLCSTTDSSLVVFLRLLTGSCNYRRDTTVYYTQVNEAPLCGEKRHGSTKRNSYKNRDGEQKMKIVLEKI